MVLKNLITVIEFRVILICDFRYPVSDMRSIYDRKSDIIQMGFQKARQIQT